MLVSISENVSNDFLGLGLLPNILLALDPGSQDPNPLDLGPLDPGPLAACCTCIVIPLLFLL